MKANGWWSEVELSDEAVEAFRWWNRVVKWRQWEIGTDGLRRPVRIGFDQLLRMYSVYESTLDKEYLFELVYSIEEEWINQVGILASKQKNKQPDKTKH